jgi:hypothetical protein
MAVLRFMRVLHNQTEIYFNFLFWFEFIFFYLVMPSFQGFELFGLWEKDLRLWVYILWKKKINKEKNFILFIT